LTRDRKKSEANYRERGFDFAFASMVFDGPTVVVEDTRRDYGERRFVAIGLAKGLHLTVVYTDRTGTGDRVTRRIISARRSNRRERRIYDQAISQG
jgi:uncharacterized DUF497 family protein